MSDEETNRLVARWRVALDRVEVERRQFTGAEVSLQNATNELAKWLTPEDAQPAEKFHVWVEGILIEVNYDWERGSGFVKERGKKK